MVRAAVTWASFLAGLLLCGAALADSASAEAEADKAYQNAQSALSQQAWAEAELHFERVLMFNPEHAEARIQLAMLLAQRGKPETASGFIESLIDDPRTPDAHRQRLVSLLAQLKAGPGPAAKASEAPPPQPAGLLLARVALGYSRNPYARADINNLTLTLPDGNTDLAVNQNIAAAPVLISSLSYLAPNLCGFDAQDQRWGASEQHFANKLLLFCYGSLGGEKVQAFASTLHSVDGNSRISAGLAWPFDSWRLTAQAFKEPQLERQGYALRLEHLQTGSAGAQTLLFAEAEKAISGVPGYTRYGFLREQPLTSTLSLQAQLSAQQDFAGYSPLLENGATRQLLFAELGLQKDWGTVAGWQASGKLQTGRRWSNLALFEFRDTTLQFTFSRAL